MQFFSEVKSIQLEGLYRPLNSDGWLTTPVSRMYTDAAGKKKHAFSETIGLLYHAIITQDNVPITFVPPLGLNLYCELRGNVLASIRSSPQVADRWIEFVV